MIPFWPCVAGMLVMWLYTLYVAWLWGRNAGISRAQDMIRRAHGWEMGHE